MPRRTPEGLANSIPRPLLPSGCCGRLRLSPVDRRSARRSDGPAQHLGLHSRAQGDLPPFLRQHRGRRRRQGSPTTWRWSPQATPSHPPRCPATTTAQGRRRRRGRRRSRTLRPRRLTTWSGAPPRPSAPRRQERGPSYASSHARPESPRVARSPQGSPHQPADGSRPCREADCGHSRNRFPYHHVRNVRAPFRGRNEVRRLSHELARHQWYSKSHAATEVQHK